MDTSVQFQQPITYHRICDCGVFQLLSFQITVVLTLLLSTLPTVGLTLKDAEKLALFEEPKIESLKLQAEALDEIAEAHQALPDLQIRSGLMNFPLETGDFRTEGMTHAMLGVRQSIPPRGSRSALLQKHHHLANQHRELIEVRKRELIFNTRKTWLEAYFSEQALDLLEEHRKLLDNLFQIIRSEYAAGTRDRIDTLQAELELSHLEDRVISVQQNQQETYSKLQYLLNDMSVSEVSGELPEWTDIPSIAELKLSLTSHPELSALDKKYQAQSAEIDYRSSALRPKWTVDIGYAFRDGGLPDSRPRSDLVSAAVSFNFPIFGKKKYEQQISAATQQRQSTLEDQVHLQRRLVNELTIAVVVWESLTKRIELFEKDLTTKTTEHYDALIESYQNQMAEAPEVIRSLILQVETRWTELRLKIDRLKIWAQIDMLVGLEQ